MERCAALRMYMDGMKETIRLERERRRAEKETTVFVAGKNQRDLVCTSAEELFKSSINRLSNLTLKGGSLLSEFRHKDRLH